MSGKYPGDGPGKNKGGNYLRLQQSRSIRNTVHKISEILNTGLSAQSVDLCMQLLEAGLHPQALAEMVIQVKRELAEFREPDNF